MHVNDILARLGNHEVIEEFEAGLREAAQKCVGRGGKSEVTLKIVMTPNDTSAVIVQSEVTVRTPKTKHSKSFFYLDEDGALTTKNPHQSSLPTLENVNE